jgi:uncharacterized protein YeaO (DUF488 family)
MQCSGTEFPRWCFSCYDLPVQSRNPNVAKKLQVKRVYEPRSASDGQRVLVDRVWPRGISKDKLGDATWLKEVAPSTDLRKWFGHRPERWKQFCSRYAAELDNNPDAIAKLRALCARGPVTLLYSARDTQHNQALALADYLAARRAQ